MFETIVKINLLGTFNVCRLIAAHIMANNKDAPEKEGIIHVALWVKVSGFEWLSNKVILSGL